MGKWIKFDANSVLKMFVTYYCARYEMGRLMVKLVLYVSDWIVLGKYPTSSPECHEAMFSKLVKAVGLALGVACVRMYSQSTGTRSRQLYSLKPVPAKPAKTQQLPVCLNSSWCQHVLIIPFIKK